MRPDSDLRSTVARVVGPGHITIIPPSGPASMDGKGGASGSYPSYLTALSSARPIRKPSEPCGSSQSADGEDDDTDQSSATRRDRRGKCRKLSEPDVHDLFSSLETEETAGASRTAQPIPIRCGSEFDDAAYKLYDETPPRVLREAGVGLMTLRQKTGGGEYPVRNPHCDWRM